MKELIQDLISKSGLSNEKFAEAVGTSPSYLSQQKKFRYVNSERLISWMKSTGVNQIESKNIIIKL